MNESRIGLGRKCHTIQESQKFFLGFGLVLGLLRWFLMSEGKIDPPKASTSPGPNINPNPRKNPEIPERKEIDPGGRINLTFIHKEPSQ